MIAENKITKFRECTETQARRGCCGAHLRNDGCFRILISRYGGKNGYQPQHIVKAQEERRQYDAWRIVYAGEGAGYSCGSCRPTHKFLTAKAIRRRMIVGAIEGAMIMLMFLGVVFVLEMICKAVTG